MQPYRVVVWGDSIAAGDAQFQWPAIAEHLFNQFLNTGRPVVIKNEGVSGKPAAEAVKEFDQRVRPHKPDLVIIQFGLNDVRHDGSRGELPLSTPEEFRRHLAEMIRRCRQETSAEPVVLGNHRLRANLRFPTGLLYDEARQVLTTAAAELCAQMNVEFHDLARELRVEGVDWTALLNDDGFHLSKLGFMTYAQFAANLIRQKMSR